MLFILSLCQVVLVETRVIGGEGVVGGEMDGASWREASKKPALLFVLW